MSGELLVKAIAREHGRTLLHKIAPVCSPLPGARKLLAFLRKTKTAHGIATSGKQSEFKKSLDTLALSTSAVVICGDMVEE